MNRTGINQDKNSNVENGRQTDYVCAVRGKSKLMECYTGEER